MVRVFGYDGNYDLTVFYLAYLVCTHYVNDRTIFGTSCIKGIIEGNETVTSNVILLIFGKFGSPKGNIKLSRKHHFGVFYDLEFKNNHINVHI